jgi:glycine/D-amino acid oxidase-like deaminating enzyme
VPGTGAASPRWARSIGGSVHQHCAARGVETEGGRLNGVVTEAGAIKTRTAVLAGGAWASSFCHQSGIRFPLATVRQAIVRMAPLEQRLPDALAGPGVAVTRRSDNSYILAISGRCRVDPTPQLMRFAPQFIPMFAKRWRNVFPGGLEGMRWGHETLARWNLDEPTPMERARILDPRPDPAGVRETHRRAVALLPALSEASIASTWAGYIDSTPGTASLASAKSRRFPASSWPPASPAMVSASGRVRATSSPTS